MFKCKYVAFDKKLSLQANAEEKKPTNSDCFLRKDSKKLFPHTIRRKQNQKFLSSPNWTQGHRTDVRDTWWKIFIIKPKVPPMHILRIVFMLGCILSSIVFIDRPISLQKEKCNQIPGWNTMYNIKMWKSENALTWFCWKKSFNHYCLQRQKESLIKTKIRVDDQDLLGEINSENRNKMTPRTGCQKSHDLVICPLFF